MSGAGRLCVAFLAATAIITAPAMVVMARAGDTAMTSWPDAEVRLEPQQPKYGWREIWMGSDALRDVWLLYTGMTLAPWSAHVYEPGWRLRTHAGHGRYTYQLRDASGSSEDYEGRVSYLDLLAGYHWREGDLTVKAFGGIAMIEHVALPGASEGRVSGLEIGPKVIAEIWLNVSPSQWSSLNLSFTTAHGTTSARWRYGVTIAEGWVIGPEIRFDTNAFLYQSYSKIFDTYLGRAGLFASTKWNGIDVSASGGIAANVSGTHTDEVGGYGTLNVLFQF